MSLKRYGFLSYARDSSNKNGKKVVDTATKQIKKSSSKLLPLSKKCGMDAPKKALKVSEAAKAKEDLIRTKIAEKFTSLKKMIHR